MQSRAFLNRTAAFLTGKVIDAHTEEVRERNYRYFYAFSVLGTLTAALTVAVGQFMQSVTAFSTEFLIFFVYFLAMYASTFYFRNHMRRIVPVFYLWLVPLMIIGTLMGTFLDAERLSVTIMVFLCVLPLLILDKPWRIILFITINAGIYAVCCHAAKSRDLFAQDMANLVLFYFFSVGTNCLIQHDRQRSVEYALVMRRASEMDALTSIYNRGAGEQNIRALLSRRQYGMFCLIDIDEFKMINDECGHICGDAVLKAVAGRLCASFRTGDVVTRIGGDEFAVYAVGVKEVAAGAVCIERLFSHIRAIAVEELWDRPVSISLGATFFVPGRDKNFETLYRESDEALYQAKRGGRSQYFFYEVPEPRKEQAAR